MSDSESNCRKEDTFKDEDAKIENTEEQYYKQQDRSDASFEDSNSDFDGDYQTVKSELELLREKNIKERDAFLAELMRNPEYADIVAYSKQLKQSKTARRVKNNRRSTFDDPVFSRYVPSPLERRRSFRLQNIPPIIFKEDLIDDADFNKNHNDSDYTDLERVIFRPKRTRFSNYSRVNMDVIPVDKVTDQMLANIARRGTIKKYSDMGTSCHQCRQKTLDQKTCCRSNTCYGVRGKFCGVCLENRYGEDAAVALKDPEWKCPVCRNICNCSYCRARAGKRPTGILTPIAHSTGYKSVKDFLESLKGEGDYAHEDSQWEKLKNINNLLGYSDDLRYAHMGGNVKHEITSFISFDKINEIIRKKENELESMIDIHDEPRSILGFIEDAGTCRAVMNDGIYYDMGSIDSKKVIEECIQKMQKELLVENRNIL